MCIIEITQDINLDNVYIYINVIEISEAHLCSM